MPLTGEDIEGLYMASVAPLMDTTIVGENEEQLVTMIVDKQLFGIPILQVQDIVEASKITPVPLAPSAIAGVLNLRGRIVTVIDLRKLLGNNEEVPWDSQMGVTVEYKGDLYTLLVDAIGDVRTLPKRDFDSAPSTMEEEIRKICSGIFRLRGNLLVVLDVSRILLPEAIAATPMLSVEDRRARKDAAQAESDEVKAAKGRQLSTLMTDLNAYESDYDSGLDSLSGDDDDIKARKKANRNRRPVNERWQEVLEEKARRDGTVSFRMREPDEEILEDAREEAQIQQAGWEEEWKAREAGEYESKLPEPDAPAEDLSGYDQPVIETPAPAPEEPAGFDAPPAFDEPPAAEEPTAFDTPEEPVISDEPEVLADLSPAPAEEPKKGFSFETLRAPEESEPVEESTGLDAPEAVPGQNESPTGVGGVVSDWWSKMRGKSNSDDNADPSEAEEVPVDLPKADEADSAAESNNTSSDTDKKTRKSTSSKSKAKSKAKPKKKKS